MSNLSVPPTAQPDLTKADIAGNAGRNEGAPKSQARAVRSATDLASPAPVPQDTVTLSLAARSRGQAAVQTEAGRTEAGSLNDTGAGAAAVSLRQLLNDYGLAGNARQNQAILSLLR